MLFFNEMAIFLSNQQSGQTYWFIESGHMDLLALRFYSSRQLISQLPSATALKKSFFQQNFLSLSNKKNGTAPALFIKRTLIKHAPRQLRGPI
jgi:hypothetical protein